MKHVKRSVAAAFLLAGIGGMGASMEACSAPAPSHDNVGTAKAAVEAPSNLKDLISAATTNSSRLETSR